MKTLADFRRDAAKGNMSLELTERFGKTGADIPENIRGIRKIVKVTSDAIVFMNDKGVKSRLDHIRASLMEYNGDSLIVYAPAYRNFNDEEKSIFADWKLQEEKLLLSKSSEEIYSLRVQYFRNSKCPWLHSTSFVKGRRLVYTNNQYFVQDQTLKGDIILRYQVYFEENTEVPNG